jgi:hypothetical protein
VQDISDDLLPHPEELFIEKSSSFLVENTFQQGFIVSKAMMFRRGRDRAIALSLVGTSLFSSFMYL